ncbi:MAG: diguanylate cyclase [Gemmatimonadetes bacterium]|nr:diguanylate cyclase [Gemmatimonadota bacterium]
MPNAVHAHFVPAARRLAIAIVLSMAAACSLRAQASPTDLEARLPSLSGLERARALAKLVDAHKIDQPEQALRYGAEALKLFKTYPDPAANVATLSELLWPHMTAGRYDSATFYADSARRFAQRAGDRAGEARAISNLGSLAQRVGDPNRAVESFTLALALQRGVGNERETANSLNNLGFVYSTDLADYPKSLSYHLEALAIRERTGDKSGVALSLNNIGIVYGRLREFDQALSYFNRALRLRREQGNKPRVASTLNNIGDVYFDKGDYPRALNYQRQALEIRAATTDKSATALSHRNIGMVYLAMHSLDEAHRELLEAMRLAAQAGDRGLGVQVRLALSQYDRAAGTPAAALASAREALAIADSMASRELVRQASAELALAQEAQGELVNALRSFKRSKLVSDSIFSAETARHIATLEQRFADERRLHEIDSLRRNQAELQLQASQRAFQRDAAAGLAILVAVVGFFLYQRRVEGARLAESLSVTDALTGLRNRRYVQQTIEMDIAASVRRCRAASVRGVAVDDADLIFLMLDIDHFKAVNDAHGHSVGDQLLVQIGTVLRTTCRDSDVVVRWGGEEFLIIARFTDRHQGVVTAERLRLAIERHTMILPDETAIRVTCSIGFAAFPLDPDRAEATGWEEMVAMADRAAYQAKRNGRNTWAGQEQGLGSGV